MSGGIIAKHYGWEWLFFLPGILSFIWAVLWSYFVYDTPAEHPRITEKELMLLPKADEKIKKSKIIPFRQILASKEIWAFILAQIGTNYQFFMVTTLFPQLMKNLLGMDSSLAGLISGLSILLHILAILLLAVICDKLATKIGLLRIRKIYIILGFFVMPMTLALAHKNIIGCSSSLAFLALSLTTIMMGFQAVSVKV
jgi:ACS family sodium-dependent inorganic phosphate cotransporter